MFLCGLLKITFYAFRISTISLDQEVCTFIGNITGAWRNCTSQNKQGLKVGKLGWLSASLQIMAVII